jgi:nucleotide-binding universal stress UspA family protein
VTAAAARRSTRQAGEKRFRRILHASDFSPASRRAFEGAIALTKANDAELVVIHVLEPVTPWSEDAYVSPRAYDRLLTSARSVAAKRLDALLRKAKAAGVRVAGRLVDGNPRDAIPRAAKRSHADLVVVGTHGRTGLGKILLGSVAERVVATAPCPVLTVRGR